MPATPDFLNRHIGSIGSDRQAMLDALGYKTLDDMIHDIVPADIRLKNELPLNPALSETDAIEKIKGIMSRNKLVKSFIGQGYYGTITPAVIQRNVLENPGWYTAYTPYQPEISQGRLEMLMNFQTMISSLTGLPVANASLLDEGTAAAEAMIMCTAASAKLDTFFIADSCHRQTIDVVQTRAEPRGIKIIVGDWATFDPASCPGLAGVLVQYPDTWGNICDYASFFEKVHAAGAMCCVAADILALTVLREPASFGADICVGNSQRFGVPMGFGGPHAGYMSVRDDLKRRMPGRLVGISIDSNGRPGYRLSLQTREQHIRRDKATSNICTAQALLAIMAAFYAAYHGPKGLAGIADRVHTLSKALASSLEQAGMKTDTAQYFDTLTFTAPGKADALVSSALKAGYNIRLIDADRISVSLDETTTPEDVAALVKALSGKEIELPAPHTGERPQWAERFDRHSSFCTEKAFNSFHSETEMMRYMHKLEVRDLALNEAMIPLGSCTMKLNAASEMMPITWPETASLHPFVPADQCQGSVEMLESLASQLAIITGFAAVSMQPNSGASGEYAGLLAIRRYLQSKGEGARNVCLIPNSAHGTNPASAAMAGFKIVAVKCDEAGNIDMDDLKKQAELHKNDLACIMVTYPSTHGVYEPTIRELCEIVHAHGGQVYMDGANMNAQVSLTNPGFIGADVCHLNLHKTFAIPHGGGGPGIGCIGLAEHLVPVQPGHFIHGTEGAVSSAYYGSASIAPISWMYIAMMGTSGLKAASEMAILNANYIAKKLEGLYPVLYTGNKGLVAHECILDTRQLTHDAGLTVDDIAKRLMDYGFHAPTMSFPVPGTLMVEPTESESKNELDRFIEAMSCIHAEITAIINGKADPKDNVMKNAPHTAEAVMADNWTHPYSRAEAAYPVPGLRSHKFWPYSGRIDNVYGDRNLICTCDTIESYTEAIHG